jgi:hypothetical protein
MAERRGFAFARILLSHGRWYDTCTCSWIQRCSQGLRSEYPASRLYDRSLHAGTRSGVDHNGSDGNSLWKTPGLSTRRDTVYHLGSLVRPFAQLCQLGCCPHFSRYCSKPSRVFAIGDNCRNLFSSRTSLSDRYLHSPAPWRQEFGTVG